MVEQLARGPRATPRTSSPAASRGKIEMTRFLDGPLAGGSEADDAGAWVLHGPCTAINSGPGRTVAVLGATHWRTRTSPCRHLRR
jgi:hypothetical protein